MEYLVDILFDLDIQAVAFNGKYDIKGLILQKFTKKYPKILCDPMVGVNLLNENIKNRELGLKPLIKRKYNHEMITFKEAAAGGKNTAKFIKYAKEDAYWEVRLATDIIKQLDERLQKLFYKILMPTEILFAEMEMAGLQWDIDKAVSLYIKYVEWKDECKEIITDEIGDLNINSGDQLAERLFNDLGYSTRGIPLTPSESRHCVDKDSMEKLARRYPVCKKIVQYRTANKMCNTYLEPLTQRAKKDKNGRIHCTFWITSTTGRTRSDDPNFQNIPVHNIPKELSIRQCVIARPGFKLGVVDLSQIELRVAAHRTLDPKFLKAYTAWTCPICKNEGIEATKLLKVCPNCGVAEQEDGGFWHGLDLHQQTFDAIEVLESRQDGKQCNFALIYNATGYRMHYEHPKYSVKQWNNIIEEYMINYSGIKKWHVEMEYILDQVGKTRDLFGRFRRIPKEDLYNKRKHALNQFINFPIQSSACTYAQLGMLKAREVFMNMGWWLKKVFPVNFIHDETVKEYEESIAQEALDITIDCMETAVQLKVPVRAEGGLFTNWGESK